MKTKYAFVVLGSQDNEMRSVEQLLNRSREIIVDDLPLFSGGVVQAVSPDGRPVSPRDAASGNWFVSSAPEPGQTVILCELAENDLTRSWQSEGCHIIRLDHHGPDDPPVPTLAQVAVLLLDGLRGLVTALADHDLHQAYRLYPDDTLEVRRSAFGWSDEQMSEASEFVASLTPREIGEGIVIWVGGLSPNQAVADLLIRDGKAGLILIPSDKEGTEKYVLSGATSAGHVEWLQQAAARLGWESYGFPSRGLGGVYVPVGHDVDELFAE